MTPQTPPTDRPLTAGDVPLLREGDVLRSMTDEYHWRKNGATCVVKNPPELAGSPGHIHYRAIRPDGSDTIASTGDPETFTFVSRPATSAASEGEGKDVVASIRDLILKHGFSADRQRVTPREAVTAAQAIVDRYPTLASPPAPERERELEGFRKMAEKKLNEAMRGDFADAPFPMGPNEAAAYHRTRADLLGWVLDMLPSNEPALTAQPAGEGK